MRTVWMLVGLAMIFGVALDCFETILQPRRVTHRFRLARLFFRSTWRVWRGFSSCVPVGKYREAYLSIFAPLSLLTLVAVWVSGLIFGFATLYWASGTILHSGPGPATFITYVYMSGTTFFTLGYGDVTPATTMGRVLAVIESGLGFSFLAVVIGYVPVLYQAYSLREVTISMLDARAGSPPTAGQLLVRVGKSGRIEAAGQTLAEWERWSAQLLESHLSFPLLSYYRSQHDNQSWLAALTCMLDSCAILITEVRSDHSHQAQLTFAMARHAAVDLSLVLKTRPVDGGERLTEDGRQRLRKMLGEAGLTLHEGTETEGKLAKLRALYEPFLMGLGTRFLFDVPPVFAEGARPDNWQTSAWMPCAPGIGELHGIEVEEHFG